MRESFSPSTEPILSPVETREISDQRERERADPERVRKIALAQVEGSEYRFRSSGLIPEEIIQDYLKESGMVLSEQQRVLDDAKCRYLTQKSQILADGVARRETLGEVTRLKAYEGLGISGLNEYNSGPKSLLKGVVDGLLFNNIAMAEKAAQDPDAFVESVKNIFTTKEGFTEALKAIGKSISDLWSGDAYATGKSLAELGLVVGVVEVGIQGVQKVVRQGIESGAERSIVGEVDGIPNSSELSSNISSTPPEKSGVQEPKEGVEVKRGGEQASEKVAALSWRESIHTPEAIRLYEKHPYLQKHAEFLGEIRESDILGEGMNGIVLRHPTNEKIVVKIANGENVDSLRQELLNHQAAFNAIEAGKKSGKIANTVRIPRVIEDMYERYGVLAMERIDGQAIKSSFLRSEYQYGDFLQEYFSQKVLDNMTDYQIDAFIRKNHYGHGELLDLAIKNQGAAYATSVFASRQDFQNAIHYLESQGITHTDLHLGNVMLTPNGDIVLIDFGRTNITNPVGAK